MADVNVVDDDISDESSFYGDEETKAELEKQARRVLKRPPQHGLSHVHTKNIRLENADLQPTVRSEPQKSGNVLDFLKSRPQIAALQKSAAHDRKFKTEQVSRNAAGDEAADLLDDKHFEGNSAAWQHHESIDDFLERAPVADPATAALGPWLWVRSAKISWRRKQQEAKANIDAFAEGGVLLMEAFSAQKEKIERSKPDSTTPATITRAMRPYREQLEDDLLALAIETGTTCGKWMLFPSHDDSPRYWRRVAEATAQGKLGPTSKVGTYDPASQHTLICCYTYDFSDTEDVLRVLEALVELDLGVTAKPIYYKCDAYTYLDIKSDNVYKLRASLYSSKEILEKEAKAMQDGPIGRLKKRNKTIDSFFSS